MDNLGEIAFATACGLLAAGAAMGVGALLGLYLAHRTDKRRRRDG